MKEAAVAIGSHEGLPKPSLTDFRKSDLVPAAQSVLLAVVPLKVGRSKVSRWQRVSPTPDSSGFSGPPDCYSVAALPSASSIAVVIPCHNEGEPIAAVVTAVRAILPTVFVVDDGSTDDTAAVAQSSGAQVLRFASNLGKGAALKTGLEHALATGFRFAIIMDGDGQHDPADLSKFLEAAAAEDADLVVGNRMGDASAMPWLRRQVNRWMSRRLSRRAGRELPDTQCGFRLIRLSVWRELDLRTTGFEVESEMLLAMIRAGRRVRFMPVRTVYRSGRSKIHPLRDTIRWFRWWWQ